MHVIITVNLKNCQQEQKREDIFFLFTEKKFLS